MNGLIFQNFPKFQQNWLKFKKLLKKLGDFTQSFAQNWTDWYMNGSLFLEKLLVFVWVYFQNPQRHVLYQNQTQLHPWVILAIFTEI